VLVRHPESVTIVALDGDELVAVRQTRPGAPKKTLELPSGKVALRESPEAAAPRELAEECGLAAASWREVASFWAVPAYSTELVHVFEADGLSPAGPAALDTDEDVEVERIALAEGFDRLDDAVSIAALALWQLRR
jgi:8-oxo-dGTP pyrophosphatase MutT (NUDIX family)